MSAYQLRAGQRGKILRLATGYDLSGTSARIVRTRLGDADPVEYTGVDYDSESLGDLLLEVAEGMFDEIGIYALEVEVQLAGGTILKCDLDVTVEVVDLGEEDEL